MGQFPPVGVPRSGRHSDQCRPAAAGRPAS
jgi:hypothetical protein